MAKAGLRIGEPVRVQAGHKGRRATYARTFADVEPGGAVVYEDSSRMIAVALSGGDAAAALGLAPDAEVKLRPWNR